MNTDEGQEISHYIIDHALGLGETRLLPTHLLRQTSTNHVCIDHTYLSLNPDLA